MKFPKEERGKAILCEMIKQEMTPQQIADELGMSYSYVVAIIYGRSRNDKVLGKIEAILRGREQHDG